MIRTNILLSTYNGEKYLREQLDSILNQSYQDFELVIRDDGSSDSTIAILNQYQKDHQDKIRIYQDELGNVGVLGSFRILMENTNADFYLFADQDDIWDSVKIEKLINLVAEENSNIPLLVVSNMFTFYEKTKDKIDFFLRYKIDESKLKNGLFRGTISGCLMLFNHSAKLKNLEINTESNMLHDCNIIMTCFLYGKIKITNNQLINHRIHSNNVVGENLNQSVIILCKDFLKYIFNSKAYRKIILKYYFTYVNNVKIDAKFRIQKGLLNEMEINNMNYFQRKKWYLKHFNPFIYGKIEGFLILMTI